MSIMITSENLGEEYLGSLSCLCVCAEGYLQLFFKSEIILKSLKNCQIYIQEYSTFNVLRRFLSSKRRKKRKKIPNSMFSCLSAEPFIEHVIGT